MSTPIAQSSAQPGTFTRAERYAAGKSLRIQVPRSRHAEWSPEPQRADPISMLEEDNRTRLPTLVPIRYGRMSLSSFTFLRGAAGIMANDLASTPISGIKTQICGDAHLGNFGIYATPERRQVFDVNDFEDLAALRCRVDAEVAQVSIATNLGLDTRDGCGSQVVSHNSCSST